MENREVIFREFKMSSSLETIDNFTLTLQAIAGCREGEGRIPQPNPIASLHPNASILAIGQAPGSKVLGSKVY